MYRLNNYCSRCSQPAIQGLLQIASIKREKVSIQKDLDGSFQTIPVNLAC